MAHDGVRALRETLGVRDDFLGETPLQTLGRELDGGERVLDLMRDAPRHIRPGGLALGGEQLRHVIEGDNETIRRAGLHLGADAHEQHPFAHRRAMFDLGRRRPFGICHHGSDKRREFGRNLGKRLANARQQRQTQQFRGGAIRQLDAALIVEANHAGGDAGQHGFGKAAPRVELVVDVHQLGPLRAELRRHAVEGARQAGHLVAGRALAHADRQIAAADFFGRQDEIANRARNLVGDDQAETDQSREHEQSENRDDQGEG